MRQFVLSLTLLSILPSALSAQNSQPLTPEEKRQIILQLIELRSARVTIAAYEEFVKREGELSEKERAVWERALELERQATALAEKERDLWKEKAEFYQTAWEASKKRGGFKCFLKTVVSFGTWACK